VPDNAVVVIVRGDSMYPRYKDGEKLFYLKQERDPVELVGLECVVKLEDGRIYVKDLEKGQGGLFDLISHNAPPLRGQSVEWAAPVLARVNKGVGR
jgi:phage repressor protein C with HTH and peptisase S24 domain